MVIKGYIADDIPNEALVIANASDFPIFLLRQNREGFDEISCQLINYIEEYRSLNNREEKVFSLVKDALPRDFVYSVGMELSSGIKGPYYAAYCLSKVEISEVVYWKTLRSLNANIPEGIAVQPFKHGMLFLVSCQFNKCNDIKPLPRSIMWDSGVTMEQYHIGFGNIHEYRDEMDYAIQESICSAIYAKYSHCDTIQFSTMGLYQMLLPLRDNRWVSNFCKKILQTITDYDSRYNTDLYSTMSTYINNGGNIVKTAASLHIHVNTVRYRVQKAMAILNMEDDGEGFFAQLSFAMLWSHIQAFSL